MNKQDKDESQLGTSAPQTRSHILGVCAMIIAAMLAAVEVYCWHEISASFWSIAAHGIASFAVAYYTIRAIVIGQSTDATGLTLRMMMVLIFVFAIIAYDLPNLGAYRMWASLSAMLVWVFYLHWQTHC